MKLPVYNRDGAESGKNVNLPANVFGIEPNEHAMYLAVKVQRTRMRQGTHASKNRSLVRGGGRKPWRQKGRGTARVGTTRSPLWRHGGTIFGPTPFEHKMQLPIKVNKLARASAFATRAAEKAIKVVEDFSFEEPRTKDLAQLLNAFELDNQKVLILTADNEPNLVRSANNIPKCNIRVGIEASTYDLLNHEVLLVQKGTLKPISEVLGGRKRATEKAA